MKHLFLVLSAFALVAAPALMTTDAHACGGCIIGQTENTQVTGHRMILSISNDRTTLWDQIQYSGSPESFAWVLPTKGTVDVGLSSDALFNSIENLTQVTITSPQIFCPPPLCNSSSASSSGSGGGGGGGVVVIAEEVVGPYQTVQLSSQDPNALKNWLLTNNYYLPPDIAPIVDAYVNEGFNFLALKLVPGKGIDSMRPVRISSPGAIPVLPLRMVAAGTGVTTPINLWVLGEGRYEPANFPSFTIKAQDLVWNWDWQASNYKVLKQNEFDASQGKAWHIAAAEPFSKFFVESELRNLAMYDPVGSGYGGDPMGPSAVDECNADLDALWGMIPENALWVTHMNAELSRAALSTDLNVQVSVVQLPVERTFNITNVVGTEPSCPPPPDWCTGGSTSGGVPPVDVNPWDDHFGNGQVTHSSPSCAMTNESNMPTVFGLLGAALTLSLVRRRAQRSANNRSS